MWIVLQAGCLSALVLAAPWTARAQRGDIPSQRALSLVAPLRTDASLDRVFARMYNLDFLAAHRLLDTRARGDRTDPLTYSVRAVADTFAEMQRLKILETEFFVDDAKVTSEKAPPPDPMARARIMGWVDEARRLAEARLKSSPNDRDALFALCMAANVMTDYTALVERKQLRGLRLAREVQTYAERLIALDPPVYDAYHAMGVLEYINSRVPFFVRWFVRFKEIEGSERKAMEYLQVVVNRGQYYGPFARVLLAVLHLRGNRPADARMLLADLAREFPENPLFPQELARVTARMHTRR